MKKRFLGFVTFAIPNSHSSHCRRLDLHEMDASEDELGAIRICREPGPATICAKSRWSGPRSSAPGAFSPLKNSPRAPKA